MKNDHPIPARGPPWTKRIALLISIIGLNLMACCCGGMPNQAQQPDEQVVIAKVDDAKPQTKEDASPPAKDDYSQPAKELDEPVTTKSTPEAKSTPAKKAAEPIARPDIPPPPNYPTAPTRPPLAPVVKPSLSSTVGGVKVELVKGTLDRVPFMRKTITGLRELETDDDMLIVRVRITNVGTSAVKYTPWYAIPAGKSTAEASDENRRYLPWFAGPVSWPVGGVEKATPIASKDSVVDVVAFEAPRFYAEEINIQLPGKNVWQAEPFRFKIGRSFFEDDATRKKQLAAVFQAKLDAHERLVASMKQDYAALLVKRESERVAAVKRIEAERETARRAQQARIDKAASAGVNRSNYNKIENGMSVQEVQDILGPGKEAARATGIQIGTWQSNPGFLQQPTIISITFVNNQVQSKAIVGP